MTHYYQDRMGYLLRLLSEAKTPLSSLRICENLGIKPRTLRYDLTTYKTLLQDNGVEIKSHPGRGYQLVILDKEKYTILLNTIKNNEHRHQFISPIFFHQRIDYIIRQLLSCKEYIKLNELADEMYISRSTLNSCLKKVRKELKTLNLSLHIKTACGIKLIGTELDIRHAIARYLIYNNAPVASSQNIKKAREKIAAILTDSLLTNAFKLTDTGFNNLIIHIEIALLRIEQCVNYDEHPEDVRALRMRDEFRIAKKIIGKLERAFAIKFPENEQYFIAIHLAGKRTLDNEEFTPPPDIIHLFEKITHKIKQEFSIDFSDDFELFHLLSLHIIPMMDRLNWGLKINNPLLEEIKQENIKAFEMAILAGSIIQKETTLKLNEAEIGYLAIHLNLAYERKGFQPHRYNVILVCASGMGSSQLLLNKIRRRFTLSIGESKVVQLYELLDVDIEDYDIVISIVEIPFKIKLPLIRVSSFLGEGDLNLLAQWMSRKEPPYQAISRFFSPELFFTDLESIERYQLLEELCLRITERVAVGSDFLQNVMEREKFSATAFGNAIAFPHPLHPCGNITFVAVALLDKPVSWGNDEVRYIFMLNIRKGEKEPLQCLHESLISLMDNSKKLAALDKNPSYSTLIKLLTCDTLPSAE
jgi:lichenan operon transcriptional antiterminator